MRLLITGDRNWRDAPRVYDALLSVAAEQVLSVGDVTLISGDARGADTYADVCAQLIGFEVERYPADWETYRRAAGPIRNQQMLDSGVDRCVAFHDDLGHSKGTRDMVQRCEKAGIEVVIFGVDSR